MFEIIGAARLDDRQDRLPNLERALLAEPWQSLAASLSKSVATEDFSLRFLYRRPDTDSIANQAGKCLILMGDAYYRWDAGESSTPRRLSPVALLEGYLLQGEIFLTKLKGNFTLILLDTATKQHRIITCKFAISPIYYAAAGRFFYFSTSLGELIKAMPQRPELDRAAVLETMLFNFPMGERTYFVNVNRATESTITTIDRHGVAQKAYWKHERFYEQEKLPAEQAYELGSELFYRSVNALADDYPRLCASFTSGFDSRALHSVLQKDRQDILAYSFGTRMSLNVTVPQRICNKLNYPFMPVYLDEEFESVFDRYAWRTVILSDGVVVQRANYPYAFEKISEFAPVVMTGLFGSEFLRTFQNQATVVSKHYASIHNANGNSDVIRGVISQLTHDSYLHKELIDSVREEVQSDVEKWFGRFGHMEPDRRFYMYLLTEVDRKYFAAETSTERLYAKTLFPFLDDEFIEFVFRAPFAGVYSQTINPSVSTRFKSQSFYVYLIRKFRPELLQGMTDHGYPPGYLLRPFPLLWVGGGYLCWRLYRRLIRYEEFRPQKWLAAFYSQNQEELFHDTGIFSRKFREDYASGVYLSNLVDFDKVGALQLWLAYLEAR